MSKKCQTYLDCYPGDSCVDGNCCGSGAGIECGGGINTNIIQQNNRKNRNSFRKNRNSFDNTQPQSQPYMVSVTSSSPSIGPAAGVIGFNGYSNQSGSLNPTGYKFDCVQATASMSFESSEAMRSWVADCKATEADDTENTSELELVGSEAIKQETKKNRNKILMFLIIGGALYYGYTKGLFSNRIN